MLSNAPQEVRGLVALVLDNCCSVTTEWPVIRELLDAGWQIHVLECEGFDKYVGGNLLASGIEVTHVRELPLPPDATVPELYGSSPAEQSDQIRHVLEELHRRHPFSFIVFPGHGGLAFRTIQARRAGLAFEETPIVLRLEANSQFAREQQQRWVNSFQEVEQDYLERFAFENCDFLIVPDETLWNFVKNLGWRLRPEVVKTALENATDKALSAETPTPLPLVTIGIAHYNLGAFLPMTLATLATQTYLQMEVIVIDDGSTDETSIQVFETLRKQYPRIQFLRQANQGIGATRNRCLELAKGEYFIPVDADNLVRPEMIAKFVTAMLRNPDYSAMSCYFLAFDSEARGLLPETYLHALRPTSGPHALASIRNVYGDANAIFRTASLRAMGGYETDRGTSCEDWELFVKLIHAGHQIGVVPDHLFYYRFRAGGFSRSTNWFKNHQRVLRQFAKADCLPPSELLALWTAILGFQQRLQQLENVKPSRAHRLADAISYGLISPIKWCLRRIGLQR